MALTRRDLLTGGAVAAGAAVAAGCGRQGARTETEAAAPKPAAHNENLSTWAGVRAELPLDPKLRHFTAFLLAPHPRPVQAEIDRHRRLLDADPRATCAPPTSGSTRRARPRSTSAARATTSR